MKPCPPCHRLPALLLGLLLSLPLCDLGGTAMAQTLWRCGADGRLFSDRPCADGQVYTVADPRSAEDVQAASRVAERERRLADQLAEERRARAQAAGSGLIGIGPQLDANTWGRKPPRASAAKTRLEPGQAEKRGRLEREQRQEGGSERVGRSPPRADKDLKRPPRPQRPRSAAGT